MTEDVRETGPAPTSGLPADLPQAVLEERGGFSFVWLIPVIAILIGCWIGWRAWSETGPTIMIQFDSAEGLEAGMTEVKFKDLRVGLVTSIELAEDLSHVTVTAELAHGAERYLTENTRFWVVRPQFTAGRATGLGTLISGAYVGIDPVLEGRRQTAFIGLNSQPIITTGDTGTVYSLRSRTLSSAQIGSPVYFRRIEVGRVVSYEMDESGEFVTTQIFVEAPHDNRVRSNTRFWDASGFDFSLNAEGISIDTVSVISLLIGGIAFDTPSVTAGGPVDPTTVFPLHPNFQASKEQVFALRRRFLLNFEDSVQGLVPGAPVVFRGIRIGEVLDVRLEVVWEDSEVRVPVIIELEPERFEGVATGLEDPGERIERLVENGFRAQLGLGNILTGQLLVEFDLETDAPPASIIEGGIYPELPTSPTPLQAITGSLASVLAQIERLPLQEIGDNLNKSLAELTLTLKETRRLESGLVKDVLPSVERTMASLERSMRNIEQLTASDAPLPREIRRTLEGLGDAAQSVRMLADYLERHPEALLQGKSQ